MPARKKKETWSFERKLEAESPESRLWFAWKRAYEAIRTAVLDDVMAATGLSDPDIGILLRIYGSGGALRQNQLALMLGWERSRLSHQLTRMEDRGLVSRRQLSAGVTIELTSQGSDLVAQAHPLHADAVRRHLIDPLGPDGYAKWQDILSCLVAEPPSHEQ